MTTINNGAGRLTGKAVTAKKVWYFTQSIKVSVDSPALLPAFQIRGDITYGGDNIDEQTKMGRVIIKSIGERSIELTQYFVPNDESIKVVRDAGRNGDSIKVWHVVIDESVAGVAGGLGDVKLYSAEFDYGMPDDVEIQDGDDLVETSYTLNIIEKLQEGEFPLSNANIVAIEASYDYQNPEETTGDFDRTQTVVAPKVGKVTPTNTGAKVELS